MKTIKFKIAFVFSMFFFSLVFIPDVIEFHNNSYATPYYSKNISQPYTNIMLSFFGESKEYWTQNAIKSENWHVKEVSIGNQTYWTLLERNPVD